MKGIVTQEMFDCIPEIDFMAGYQYFLKNLDNYTQALLSTLKSIKSKLPVLQSMVLSGEYEGLRTISQTLRKMTDNIGAKEIAELSYELECALLNKDKECLQIQLVEYLDNLKVFSLHLETPLKQLDVKSSSNQTNRDSKFLNYDFTKTKESIKLSADLIKRKSI